MRATILGGPRDGDIVDWIGHQLVMPVLPLPYYLSASDQLAPPREIRTLQFVAQQDDDGRWFYVMQRMWPTFPRGRAADPAHHE